LNVIVTAPLNAASQTTSGLDFQADYTTDLFDGNMDWHMVGNYTDEYTQTALGLVYDGAGQLSASAPGLNGDVKLHLNMTATYTEGPWSGTIGGRFLGQAALNNYWQTGVNVDENTIPFVAYLDFRGSYKWNDHMQLYGTISNATNTPPPHVPSAVGGSGTNTQIYDGIGRMYQAGVRVDF
jgi:outer membrane receptor protein involved in Fe transport